MRLPKILGYNPVLIQKKKKVKLPNLDIKCKPTI